MRYEAYECIFVSGYIRLQPKEDRLNNRPSTTVRYRLAILLRMGEDTNRPLASIRARHKGRLILLRAVGPSCSMTECWADCKADNYCHKTTSHTVTKSIAHLLGSATYTYHRFSCRIYTSSTEINAIEIIAYIYNIPLSVESSCQHSATL